MAGNVSDWTDHFVRVDTVLPTDTTVLPTGWRTTPVDVTVKGVDGHSGVDEVQWIIDGGEPSSDPSEGQFQISADGEHTIQTLVRDVAGNVSGWKAHSVKIDTTPPLNLTSPSTAWAPSHHVVVAAEDAVTGSGVDRVEWQIDGGPWQDGHSGSPVDFDTTGSYELTTRARDVAGNVSPDQVDTVWVDADAPTNTTLSPPPGDSSSPYQVAVTGGDLDSGVDAVQWRVDGVDFSGAPGDVATVTGTGTHTLMTRVRDVAGNWSGWRTDTFTIDATLGDNVLPVDTTTGGSTTIWRKNSHTVTVQAVDAGSGVALIEYRRPGILAGDTTTMATLTITDEGDNIVETRVTDHAGKRTPWLRHHVKIDASLPIDTIDIPEGWQRSNSFTLSATDTRSGVDEILYTINGGAERVGHPGDPVPVADGIHVIESRVTDNAGHSSASRHGR